jgi:hypothetical protein
MARERKTFQRLKRWFPYTRLPGKSYPPALASPSETGGRERGNEVPSSSGAKETGLLFRSTGFEHLYDLFVLTLLGQL